MSANRSVQAAQRRRAGPPEPAAPGRGPQPSINSSQMFAAGANQRMGPGSGQVSGRLAGQQAALSQKQMMEQQKQRSTTSNPAEAIGSINKMTFAQAITLITLRLGKVETQLMNGVASGQSMSNGDADEDHILVDKSLIHSLINRIDALEKRPSTSASGPAPSNQDIMLLKQQFETIKPIVIQSKNSLPVLKQQVEILKTELNETKELFTALQNLTMDNSNKILALNSVFNNDGAFLDDNLEPETEFETELEVEVEEEAEDFDTIENDISLDPNINVNDIMGNNLKKLIEQEFYNEDS
jgi:hypothetical protein